MTHYEDDTVLLDDDGVTIRSYRRPRDGKRIGYGSIRGIETFEMGFWSGRHRLVGISLGRPRAWFAWDRHRDNRHTAISLDVGGWIRPTLAPEDAEAVEAILLGVLDADDQPRS